MSRIKKNELRSPVMVIIPEICSQAPFKRVPLLPFSLPALLSVSLLISLSVHLHQHSPTKGNVSSLSLIFPSILLPAVSPPFPCGPGINNSQSPAETTAWWTD